MGLAVPEDDEDDDDDILSPKDAVNCHNTAHAGDNDLDPTSDDPHLMTSLHENYKQVQAPVAAADCDNGSKSSSTNSDCHDNSNDEPDESEKEELMRDCVEMHPSPRQPKVEQLKTSDNGREKTSIKRGITSTSSSSSSSSKGHSASSVSTVTDVVSSPLPLTLTPKKRRFDVESLLLPDNTPPSPSHSPRALAIY
jgi:hypothetical protein